MSHLTIYSQFNMRQPYLESEESGSFSEELSRDGVVFEKWPVRAGIDVLSKQQVFDAYKMEIQRTKKLHGCSEVELSDVSRVRKSSLLRDQFLSEHTHSEAEIRFFLQGSALVYVHASERIYIIRCGAGDFISIPAGVKHWFDMGPSPQYVCLRWYNSEEGLQNIYTSSFIAESTPRWESIVKPA